MELELNQIAPLFLLSLTGGYFFCKTYYRTKWLVARFHGQRLLFESAFWGICLIIPPYVLHIIFEITNLSFHEKLHNYIPPEISILLTSFFLGPIMGLFLNLSSPVGNFFLSNFFEPLVDMAEKEIGFKDICSRYIIEKYGDDLEKLFDKASILEAMVLLTMKNNKVYIGWAVEAPKPEKPDNIFMKILPAFSGYRCSDTLELVIKTQYIKTYEKIKNGALTHMNLNFDDFIKIIRVDEITSANIYENRLTEQEFHIPPTGNSPNPG